MSKLHISDSLALPIEAVTETFAFLGRRGSGKSYAAQKMAEEVFRAKAQFVVLDPVGIWYGLRLAADGKRAGLEIPVLGGLRGDIPLEPAGGALIANLVVDRGASMILDVSQFETDTDKARFAHDFADRFFFRKKSSPSAVHLFIDEAQEFIPQYPQKNETRMLHVFTRLLKLGRNFGIGASMLSQRPQEVNKKALNLAEVLFAFQMTGPQERKTVDGWIADKGIEDEDIAAELPKLERGHPHVWSPAWLKISRIIKIAERTTFDASSTPKVGKTAAASDLTPIDLEKLRTDMAATIERAKADDPRELRREIAALKKQLAARPTAVEERAIEKIVEVPMLKNGQIEKAHTLIERIEDRATSLDAEAAKFRDLARSMTTVISEAVDRQEAPPSPRPRPSPRPVPTLPPKHNPRPVPTTPAPRPRPPVPAPSGDQGDVKFMPSYQKVLDSIAMWRALGFEPIDRKRACLVAGLSPKASTFGVYVSELLKGGYLSADAGMLCLSPLGLDKANHPVVQPTAESLREIVRTLLEPQEKKVFDAVYDVYPDSIHRDDLADKVGLSKTASTIGVYLSASTSIGLIESLRGKHVQVAAWLFPE